MIRRYFKNIRILAITEVILQLRGLVLMPFITGRFGTVNYGIWSQVSVMASSLSMFVVFGTDSAFLRLAPGKKLEEQKAYFSALVFFLLGTSALIAWPIFAWPTAISNFVFGTGNPEYEAFLSLGIAWLIVGIILSIIRNWFRVQNQANLYSANILLQSFFSILATVAMLVRGEGVWELIVYSIVGDLAIIAISLTIIGVKSGFARPNFSVIPKMLRFGAPLIPAGLAMWGLNYMDRFFLVRYASLADLGIYASANTIAYQIIPVLAKPWWVMFSNSSAQLFTENRKQELQRLFDLAMGATLALVVPAIFGLRFLGERIFILFTSADFLGGAPVLLLASSAFLFGKVAGSFEHLLALKFRHGLATYSKIAAFAVNLLLNAMLIPKYGFIGAAVATVIAFFISMIMTTYFAFRENLVQIKFPFIGKILFAALLMLGALKFTEGFVVTISPNLFVEIILFVTVGALFYFTILWLLKIIDRKMLTKAFGILRR